MPTRGATFDTKFFYFPSCRQILFYFVSCTYMSFFLLRIFTVHVFIRLIDIKRELDMQIEIIICIYVDVCENSIIKLLDLSDFS